MVHLGIIPDGNRRWCVENNIPKDKLSSIWLNNVIEMVNELLDLNENKYEYLSKIDEFSIYICSIDNFDRDDNTIKLIFHFLKEIFKINIFKKLNKYNYILNFIGEIDKLPPDIQDFISKNKAIYNNENSKTITINFALAYSYENDLCNYGVNNNNNYNRNQSDIDILFRSGKEKRISGFFPTKILYSELFFTDKYWPDINLDYLNNLVKKFCERNRRFGK